MSGAAFLRLKKLKGGGIISVAARHNRRVIQAEMGASSSIDPTRSHLNETLMGPPTADDVAQLAKDLMRQAGVTKLRKDAVVGLEIVFSLPPDHQTNDRAYFAECATWAGNHFGGVPNILSVDVHRDEAAPHCHVLLLPLINGKMGGSDMVGGKQKLLALQKDFHEAVASRHGLRKAPARLSGASKQAGASAVLKRLRDTSDSAQRSAAWPALREAIERDPGPFLLLLGIEVNTPSKRTRTMAEIFTSKGKGKAHEENPIGFEAPPKKRTLCSVGFSPKLPPPTPAIPPVADTSAHEEMTVRVRECDLDPALYDPESGEYFQQPQTPTKRQRQAADAWVAQALGRNTR